MREKIFDPEFWDDLDSSIAWMVKKTIAEVKVKKIATKLGCSDQLIYKWTYDDEPQQPSLKQFLTLIRNTGNLDAIRLLAQSCGFLIIKNNHDLPSILRQIAEQIEK